MDREKEIWKMVEIAREYSKDIANTPYYLGVVTDMTALYEAGYRKAVEVRKETAKEILQDLYDEAAKYDDETISLNTYGIKQWATKFGIEVDK